MTFPVRLSLAFALLAACASNPSPGGPVATEPDALEDTATDFDSDDAPDARAPAPDTALDTPADATIDSVTDASPDVPRDTVSPDATAPDVTSRDAATTDDTPTDTAPLVDVVSIDAAPIDATPSDASIVADISSPDAALDRPVIDATPDVADVTDATPDIADAPPDCTGPTCPLQVVTGTDFACARFADGTVSCWGSDLQGQIGDGTADTAHYRDRATPALGLTDVVELAAGANHACARRSDGTVWCWGANGSRQIGSGRSGTPTSTPVAVADLTGAVHIACGSLHSCAIVTDGTVRCWGGNTLGQIGDGTTTMRPTPVAVPGLTGVRALAAGANFTCAALSDGTARCWGESAAGQLGVTSSTPITTPSAVPGVTRVTALSAGTNHACALRDDGTAQCWGENTYGALGDPASTPVQRAPVTVALTPRLRSIHAGHKHTCAVTVGDAVHCWGANEQGELGDGRTGLNAIWNSPTLTRDLAPAQSLSAGRAFNCAVTRGGAVACWGNGLSGQLGNGAIQGFATPQAVPELRGVAQVEARGDHTCARLAYGSVRCWGAKVYFTFGGGLFLFGTFVPFVVPSVNADEVSVGVEHVRASLHDGSVRCWGSSSYGALGNPAGDSSPGAFDVAGVRASALSLGWGRSCALGSDGTVRCWGRNLDGDLGIGAADSRYHAAGGPPVEGVTTATALGAGRYHECAVLRDRSIVCWGATPYGESGGGPAPSHASPIAVPGVANATQVAGGTDHTCARLSDGTVLCWGLNGNGQCGADLSVSPISSPTRVGTIADARSIAAGDAFTCALRADGTVWCWGSNNNSQLGETPASTGRGEPAAVRGLSGVTAITAGASHACALLGDGTVRCWGAYTLGQLGLGHVYVVRR